MFIFILHCFNRLNLLNKVDIHFKLNIHRFLLKILIYLKGLDDSETFLYVIHHLEKSNLLKIYI